MTRADLEAERDLLLRSLRNLEAEYESGELAQDDYDLLRDDYTVRAADVLRQLAEPDPDPRPTADPRPADPGPADPGPADPGPAGPRSEPDPAALARRMRRRRKRGGLVGLGAVLILGGTGLVVWGHTGARQTGQSVSGSVPLAPAQELIAARQALSTNNDVMALKLFQAVLNVEPDQPEALAYSGWLLRLAGDVDQNPSLVAQGIEAEEAAVRADPQYPDAHYFLGVMLLDEANDPSGAVIQLEDYLASHPASQDAKAVEPVLARARAEATAAAQAPATTRP